MPHSVRQEYKVDIAGRSFVMRPTFIGLDKFETHIDMSIFGFTNMVASTGNIKLRDLVMCLWCGIYGDLKDQTPKLEDLGELVVEEGPMNLVPIVTEFLMSAMLDESQAAEIRAAVDAGEENVNGKKQTTAKKSGTKKNKTKKRRK